MKGKINSWIGNRAGIKFVLRSFMFIHNRNIRRCN